MGEETKKMSVLAISGSPRQKSFTDYLLTLFLEGMGDNIDINKYYAHQLDIKTCTGCLNCWVKTPGRCIFNDDMKTILSAMEKADIIILAAPLYVDGLPAQVKVILDRCIPMVEKYVSEDKSGRFRHKRLHPKNQKAVLIVSSGFPEQSNFEPVKAHFSAICENFSWENSGQVLFPASGLSIIPHIFDRKAGLVMEAGRELAKFGKINKETCDQIAAEISDKYFYGKVINASFDGNKATILRAIRELEEKDGV